MATQVSLTDGAVASAGALAIQTNGTTQAVSISTGQVATLAQNPILTSGTANGVAYLNGSKAVTSGSALVFDGTNLGLGVTPSAWTGVFKAAQVKQGSISTDSSNNTTFANNCYFDGSNWKYINTAASQQYLQYAGQHIWTTAASGTAGNAITFTTAMTLDASGNFLVGTTSAVFPSGQSGMMLSRSSQPVLRIAEGSSYFDLLTTGDNVYINNRANGFMAFYTNATERARIDSSGNLLVGTTSNAANYRVNIQQNGQGVNGIYCLSTAASSDGSVLLTLGRSYAVNNTIPFVSCVDSAATRAEIRNNGGIANYSANNVNLSDRNEKTNFAPAGEYLSKICAIPVQTFNYIDQNLEEDPGLTLGVVAQDVQAVAPELVLESNWGTEEEPKMRLSIYQTDLQYALMKCIQEQQAIIQSLTDRITALESA